MDVTSIFVENTKDIVEQLYRPQITTHFPNYAVFWEEFIGDPCGPGPELYGLVFDKNTPLDNKAYTSPTLLRFLIVLGSLTCWRYDESECYRVNQLMKY